jgi:son of sevenless-like protein
MEERLQDRVKLVSKLIQIASKLRSLNNFNGLMAILSGLNRGPVYRLRQTVAALEKKKEGRVYRLWQDLVNLTSSDHSYNVVRKALKSVSPPSIPYLGMYLTDLTFIEEGNKKFLTEHKLINFFKRRLTAATIVDIQTYQALGYAISPHPEIQAKLQGEPTFDEDSLYELSLYLEPRPGQYVIVCSQNTNSIKDKR